MLKSKQSAKIITLILMILSLNTIYQLPYLMYYYYTPLQEAMGLIGRDADYGSLLNFYGIMNVVLYIPGGWIADKFSAKWLMVISMVGTGLLGLWESTFPSYETLKLIMALYAVTTVLTFWSASIKCINLVADKNEQGGMFGALEAGRSVCGLLVTTLFTTIYAANAANSTVAMGTIIRT
ncbi:MAG: MFS transporter, partial [Faecalibacterium sp.]|nr:MFS transporter [Faecalibacterium sp.]